MSKKLASAALVAGAVATALTMTTVSVNKQALVQKWNAMAFQKRAKMIVLLVLAQHVPGLQSLIIRAMPGHSFPRALA